MNIAIDLGSDRTRVFIENKAGTLYDINTSRTYASGIYRIYQKRKKSQKN